MTRLFQATSRGMDAHQLSVENMTHNRYRFRKWQAHTLHMTLSEIAIITNDEAFDEAEDTIAG